VTTSGDIEFFRRHVLDNEFLGDRRSLVAELINSSEPRDAAAARLGMSLGSLLRELNHTAPIEEPLEYVFARRKYEVRSMRGPCDDYCGERYGKFGDAITLRFYFGVDIELPQQIFEAADWNFLDGGFPRFCAYAYGTMLTGTLFLSGIQSDLAARYAYLFQQRGGKTAVRVVDDVVVRDPYDRPALAIETVAMLRRVFQRKWLLVVLAGIRRFMSATDLNTFALQNFELSELEEMPGHQMRRIYRDLPDQLSCEPLVVLAGDRIYKYRMCSLTRLGAFVDANRMDDETAKS
jgi:hypothetical protein